MAPIKGIIWELRTAMFASANDPAGKLGGETASMGKIVPLDRLGKEGYGQVICYPKCDAEELSRRLAEMRRLGLRALCFEGGKKVNNIPVLGKGGVGIVVSAYTPAAGKIALKIRRIDADRTGMKREAEMLQLANSASVGPKLLGFTENVLMMEFVDGDHLPKWLEALEEEEDTRLRLRRVLREILEQCRRLDESGLDHGELSRAPKHIIIAAEDKVYILDFETASTTRRVSNVTSVCHYLLLGGKTADLVTQRIGEVAKEDLVCALGMYKKSRTRENFEKILGTCLVQGF